MYEFSVFFHKGNLLSYHNTLFLCKTGKVKLISECAECCHNIQNQLQEIITAGNNTQQKISEQYKNAIESTKLNLTAKSETIVVDFEKQFSNITEKYKETYESQQKEFSQLIMNAQNILAELEDKKNKKESQK